MAYQQDPMLPMFGPPPPMQSMWIPMPDRSQQTQDATSGLLGVAPKLKDRFKKPGMSGMSDSPMPSFLGGGSDTA